MPSQHDVSSPENARARLDGAPERDAVNVGRHRQGAAGDPATHEVLGVNPGCRVRVEVGASSVVAPHGSRAGPSNSGAGHGDLLQHALELRAVTVVSGCQDESEIRETVPERLVPSPVWGPGLACRRRRLMACEHESAPAAGGLARLTTHHAEVCAGRRNRGGLLPPGGRKTSTTFPAPRAARPRTSHPGQNRQSSGAARCAGNDPAELMIKAVVCADDFSAPVVRLP